MPVGIAPEGLILPKNAAVPAKAGTMLASTDADGRLEITDESGNTRPYGQGVPNGLNDSTKFSLAYNESTREVTVTYSAGALVYTSKGKVYGKTGDTVLAHPASSGVHFFYFNTSGVLTTSTVPWDLKTVAPVALVYYNATTGKGFIVDERHIGGPASWPDGMHEYMHTYYGSQYRSGFAISGYTPNSGVTADLQWVLDTGIMADEDIASTLLNVSKGVYTLFERSGADVNGEWTWTTGATVPFFTTGGNPQYNELVGGNWQKTAITVNNRWVNYWIIGIPALTGNLQIMVIAGQTLHTSLTSAQGESVDAGISWAAFPSNEKVPLWKVTLRRVGASGSYNTQIAEVSRLITRSSSVSGLAPSVHNALSGRPDPGCHPAAAISFDPSGVTNLSIVSVEVNAALTELANQTVFSSAAFANDNRLLRTDGTGRGAQASVVTLSDGGALSGVTDVSMAGALTVRSGSMTALLGADTGATTLTDATTKMFRLGSPHYLNAEEPLCVSSMANDATTAILEVGGGRADMNAVTQILFYAAANNTTLSGTAYMDLSPSRLLVSTAIHTTKQLDMTGMAAPAVSAAGHGILYFDSTANKFKVSENNGAYVDLIGGGGTPAGSDTYVQFNTSGSFDADASFTYNKATYQLLLEKAFGDTGDPATPITFINVHPDVQSSSDTDVFGVYSHLDLSSCYYLIDQTPPGTWKKGAAFNAELSGLTGENSTGAAELSLYKGTLAGQFTNGSGGLVDYGIAGTILDLSNALCSTGLYKAVFHGRMAPNAQDHYLHMVDTGASATRFSVDGYGRIAVLTPSIGADARAIVGVTATWNSGATAFDAVTVDITDTSSSVNSYLATYRVGGVVRTSLRKDGKTTFNGFYTSTEASFYGTHSNVSATPANSGSTVYAVQGTVTVTNSNVTAAYGGLFSAVGNTNTTAYGIYASASGGDSNYAAYFSGKTEIAQGTITSDLKALRVTSTWNNGSVVFTGLSLTITDTASDYKSGIVSFGTASGERFRLAPSGAMTVSGQNATVETLIGNRNAVGASSGGITVVGTSTLGAFLNMHSAGSGADAVEIYSSNGTFASPTAKSSGDNLFIMNVKGYNGSNFIDGFAWKVTCDETWSSGVHGTRMTFSQNPTLSGELVRFYMGKTGKLGLSSGSTSAVSPTDALELQTGNFAIQAGYLDITGISAPSVSASGHVRLYVTSGGIAKISENGGAYVNLVGGSASKEIRFNIAGANVGYTNSPTPGTFVSGGTPETGMVVPREDTQDYSNSTDQYASWSATVPDNYAGETVTVEIEYMLDSVTSGDVTWKVAFAATGDSDNMTNKIAANKRTTTSTVPGTAKVKKRATITFTQSQADSMVAGDKISVIVGRDTAAGTPAAAAARMTGLRIYWS